MSEEEGMGNGATVLIVDDEEGYCSIVRTILEGYGLQVYVAYTASGALAILKGIKPDLLVVDVMMPGIDGLDLVRGLRRVPDWDHTPIIVASAKVMKGDREAALEAGADAFLEKPFSAKEMRALLRRFILLPGTDVLEARIRGVRTIQARTTGPLGAK